MRPPFRKALQTFAALFASLTLLASTAGVVGASGVDDSDPADPMAEGQDAEPTALEAEKAEAEKANKAERAEAEKAEAEKAEAEKAEAETEAEAEQAEQAEQAEVGAAEKAENESSQSEKDEAESASVRQVRSESQGQKNPGPPGNNGTVKIDGVDLNDGPGHSDQPNDPSDDGTDNDPHVTCGFQVEFFNFDEGQTADIVFTAHPPTGNGGVLLDQTREISDDGTAGAANDLDEVFTYNVLSDFDTDMFTDVHDVHGWHVKLSLTIYDADGTPVPGGKKHKVFWVEDCAPEVGPETCPDGETVITDETDADDNGVADMCEPEVADVVCPDGTTVTEDENDDGMVNEDDCADVLDADEDRTPEGPVTPAEPTTPGEPGTPDEPATPASPAPVLEVKPVAVTPVAAPAAANNPRVLGSQVTRSSQLPRTGDETTNLVPFGLGLVLLGFGLQHTSKRFSAARVS